MHLVEKKILWSIVVKRIFFKIIILKKYGYENSHSVLKSDQNCLIWTFGAKNEVKITVDWA